MTDRPSERAMKAAVSMEIHATCSTSTLGKGVELDKAFPAYDEILEALKEIVRAVCGETGFANAVRIDSGTAYPWEALDIAEAKARAVIAKAS